VQYDAINGTPSCINGWMSNTVARETWGWEGTIYTDCGALRNVNAHFHKFQSGEHTAAVAIKQGTDLECDSVLKKNLGAALNHSLLDVEDLRVSASRYVSRTENISFKRLFKHIQIQNGLVFIAADSDGKNVLHCFDCGRTFLMFMKLGMFDKVSDQPMANYNDTSIVAGEQHHALALESARQSVVLLQNPGKILPLQLKTVGENGQQQQQEAGQKVAAAASLFVGGPSSNLTDAFLGEYRPVPCADGSTDCLTTALQAIQARTSGTKTHIFRDLFFKILLASKHDII
jgi:beta-glucosidase-like glycosyl hydrolase